MEWGDSPESTKLCLTPLQVLTKFVLSELKILVSNVGNNTNFGNNNILFVCLFVPEPII